MSRVAEGAGVAWPWVEVEERRQREVGVSGIGLDLCCPRGKEQVCVLYHGGEEARKGVMLGCGCQRKAERRTGRRRSRVLEAA